MIDENAVPSEFVNIPREHWRSYPASWQDRHDMRPAEAPVTLQVQFGGRTHWTGIRGTRVRELRQSERPNYDIFRYGSNYYVYNHNRWYMSRRSTGQFAVIDDRFVPRDFSNIPREHWRNYPTAWLDENGNPRRGNQGRDRWRGDGYRR